MRLELTSKIRTDLFQGNLTSKCCFLHLTLNLLRKHNNYNNNYRKRPRRDEDNEDSKSNDGDRDYRRSYKRQRRSSAEDFKNSSER